MTEQILSQDADRDHLQLALAIGNVGVWELNTETGAAWRNQRHDEIFGYRELLPAWTYEMFLSHVVADHRVSVDRCYGDAIANAREWAFECRIRRSDGEHRWISVYGRPLKSAGGRVTKLIGHVIDITETKRTEEHLRLVTSELNHRVRNMLAMISALVQESARSNESVAECAKAIQSRVAALSRTYDLLSVGAGEDVSLGKILRTGLEAFDGFATRVCAPSLDSVALHRSTAEKFALVTHELMTNAIKYGALSNKSGRISISCKMLGDKRVSLIWREIGGPIVSPPRRAGFGSTLLAQVFGDEGGVELDFRSNGLVCTMNFSVAATSPAEIQSNVAVPQPEIRSGSLANKTILVVEDEPLIGISYRAFFSNLGAEVVGPYASCEKALQALDVSTKTIDVAILDVNLGRETSDVVAQTLDKKRIPFIFTTGYSSDIALAKRYPDAIFLTKPAMPEEIEASLLLVMEKAEGDRVGP